MIVHQSLIAALGRALGKTYQSPDRCLSAFAPLREVAFTLWPKSEILIHRDFSFQRNSKPFKAVQRYSKLFTCIIFLFLCAYLKNPVWPSYLAPHRMELGPSLELGCCPESFRGWNFA